MYNILYNNFLEREKIMYTDYHIHSTFSPDGKSSMEEMILRAIDLNLKEICFTDHVDYDIKYMDHFVVDYEEYFKSLNYFIDKYKGKIRIKKGIELGLQKELFDKCSKDVKKYPFDFVICSQHAIDKMDLYYNDFFESKDAYTAYDIYYKEYLNIVKNYKDYNTLGHLDLIKRYGPYDEILDDDYFIDIITEILRQVIYDGKGIEINTSCFKYNLPDLTPSRKIIELYKSLCGEIITTGSDAHATGFLACNFKYIYDYLKSIGFEYVCTFDKMKPLFNKI